MMMKFCLDFVVVVVLSSTSFPLQVEVLALEKTSLWSLRSLAVGEDAVLVLVVFVELMTILSVLPDFFHQEKVTVL